MNNSIIIAKKEFKDILRSRIFMYILVLLFVLVAISLLVSLSVFKDQVAQYNDSLNILKSLGKQPTSAAPQLHPLNLLRGVVDYIEIIGAILGIFLGYLSIFKERNSHAIKLLITRPVRKTSIITGKLLGNFSFVFLALLSIALLIMASLPLLGGVVISFVEIIKILIFVLLSTFYIMIFFSISLLLSLSKKNIVNALIVSFVIWLTFVLILPQIGDTMDPDNQVPGGFFKSMGLNRPQEKKVLVNFNNYEKIRGGVEQLSITKHYERSIFALFGIKADYNDWKLGAIMKDQLANNITVIVFFLLAVLANILLFKKSQNLLE